MNSENTQPANQSILPGVKHVIAVASGKGGVGKSTLTTNLACAVQQTGATVGILDADIYGPSIPKMVGAEKPPLTVNDKNEIIPWNHQGIKVMSMGFLATESTPTIWRGPMVHNILTQFFKQVAWGSLDYLFIDLPPGTGDAQLTITQTVPLTGAVIVTTPQEVSIQIASKGLQMFEQVNVPVFGMIENMSYYCCPNCDHTTEPFRRGGTKKAAAAYEVPFLGEVPLDPAVALDGDNGAPTVISHPNSAAGQAYTNIADALITQMSQQLTQAQATEQAANLSLDWQG